MGRTVTPYSMQLQIIRRRLQNFRRALRKEDQLIFDELFRHAKFNVQAGVMAANPNPIDSILLAILIEQQKQINELRRQLDPTADDAV